MATDEKLTSAEGEADAALQAEFTKKHEGDSLPKLAQGYLKTQAERKRLEAEAEAAKAQENLYVAELLRRFELEDASSIRVKVKIKSIPTWYNVTPFQQVVPDLPKGKDAALQALKDSKKYAYLVKEDYNWQSLRSLLKEIYDDDKRELPPSFEGRIAIRQQWAISVTKAK